MNANLLPGSPGRPYPPIRSIDRADVLCDRIDAIADCMGNAVAFGETLNKDSILSACDAVRELLGELHEITNSRAPVKDDDQ